MKNRILASLVILSLLMVSCSTTTHFNSSTPVDVYVDGQYIGKTPEASVRLSDAVWNDPQCYYVDAFGQQGGCYIEKEVKVGAIIGGIFLWPIFLWAYGPKANQMIVVRNNQPAVVVQEQVVPAEVVESQPRVAPAQPQAAPVQPPQGYLDANGQIYYIDGNGEHYYLDPNGRPYYLDKNGRPYYK